MKEAKKIVLKTHPDRSRLDNKYFLFFSKAYKKLLDIYEFQNKINSKKTADKNDYFENGQVLDKMFEMKKDLKDTDNFNKWFNDQFEKHRLEDPVEHGYGNWLKSDEDIIYTPQNINKDSMAREMDKRKKEIQALTPYSGVGNSFGGSSVGGSSLMEYNSNFSSGSLFSSGGGGYTDLRQAYVESVIPVTEDDYNKTQKFKSVDEYKRHRENINVVPLSKEDAMRQLFEQEKKENDESAAMAFYYAQQSEKAKKNSDTFWSGLQQITNW
jgi:curved DNA-binding protein CbpA